MKDDRRDVYGVPKGRNFAPISRGKYGKFSLKYTEFQKKSLSPQKSEGKTTLFLD